MRRSAAAMTLLSLASCSEGIAIGDLGSCEDLEPSVLVQEVRDRLDPFLSRDKSISLRFDLAETVPAMESISEKASECARYNGNAPSESMSAEQRAYYIDRMQDFTDVSTSLNWVILDLERDSGLITSLFGLELVWQENYEAFTRRSSGT